MGGVNDVNHSCKSGSFLKATRIGQVNDLPPSPQSITYGGPPLSAEVCGSCVRVRVFECFVTLIPSFLSFGCAGRVPEEMPCGSQTLCSAGKAASLFAALKSDIPTAVEIET